MSRQHDTRGTELDSRESAVLRAVVEAHVATGEPVGSVTVSRQAGLRLSPAPIRGVMAALEERGLLVQRHTSAGRTPTDAAWRLYVDRWLRQQRLDAVLAGRIDEELARSRGEVGELLGAASRQLSQFSNQVGLVLAPDFRRIVVERLEFVRLPADRVVAILVGASGVVHHRILRVESWLDQHELDRIGGYLSEQFGGRTLPAMRAELERRLCEERARYDREVARSFELGRRTVAATAIEGEVFVGGASNLIGSPEFADPGRIKSLLRALEEKNRLVELLSRLMESRGVQVVIGEENALPALADCSLIASTYGAADRPMGTIGIVGPTRMEYARAIGLVEHLAGVLSRLLSERGGSGPGGGGATG